MEWFRGDGWSLSDQEEFQRRIDRARGHRAFYLAQKGVALLAAPDNERRLAGQRLLQRVINKHPNDTREVATAQRAFAKEAARDADVDSALAAYRAVLQTEGERHCTSGTELDLAELILRHDLTDSYDEAEDLLDLVLGSDPIFGIWRYRYCLARARVAAERERADEAAAFAEGAIRLFLTDRPAAPRHPTVGLIETDQAALDELTALADDGDPRRYDPRIARRLDEGGDLDWQLLARLKRAAGDNGRQDRREIALEVEDRILRQLRNEGLEFSGLSSFSVRSLSTKAAAVDAAKKVLKVYGAVEDPLVKLKLAETLGDRRVSSVATQVLLDDFKELHLEHLAEGVPPRTGTERELGLLKESIARSLSQLFEPDSFEEVAGLIRDPSHGWLRGYIFWAVPRMRCPEAVDLTISLLDDPEVGPGALRALADLKADAADPFLSAVAAEPYPKGEKGDAAANQRTRVEVARSGLKKLKGAREQGRQIRDCR